MMHGHDLPLATEKNHSTCGHFYLVLSIKVVESLFTINDTSLQPATNVQGI